MRGCASPSHRAPALLQEEQRSLRRPDCTNAQSMAQLIRGYFLSKT